MWGDFVEIMLVFYGVIFCVWYFWFGEGWGDVYGGNLYENFVEVMFGKGLVLFDLGVNFVVDVLNMEKEV